MTAIIPVSAVLVPTTMREAMDLATVMAQAGFLAKELQTPGGAMFVIEQAMRWNMSPFAVAMETSFIQSKPMFSGKVVAAAVTSSGAITGRLAYTYDGSGDDRRITVVGVLRGESEPRSVTVALRDARTNNRIWQSQPDQQLAYHGARVWARRHAPEVMLGVASPEEMEETPAPAAPRDVPNLAPNRPAPDEPEFPWITMDGKRLELRRALWMKALTKALDSIHDSHFLWEWHHARKDAFEALPEDMAAEAQAVMMARLDLIADPGAEPDDA
jgi:hypothetical protein